jgi:A/G-specific adenine glycosylase
MDYGSVLKRKVHNPSRNSAHYAKQTRFEGSLRQARGAILRQLTKNVKMTLDEIAKIEHIDYARLQKAAEGLCTECLLCHDGDLYLIDSGTNL